MVAKRNSVGQRKALYSVGNTCGMQSVLDTVWGYAKAYLFTSSSHRFVPVKEEHINNYDILREKESDIYSYWK